MSEVKDTCLESLKKIYKRYATPDEYPTEDRIVIPTHQRESRWSMNRHKAWWKDINTVSQCNKSTIEGTVILYRTRLEHIEAEKGAKIPVKINDGSQRTLHSIKKYIDQETAGGRDPWPVLDRVKINVQYIIYKDENEAYERFLAINASGTGATPFELSKGIITGNFNDKEYMCIWEPKLNQLHNILSFNFMRVCGETDNDPSTLDDQSKVGKIHKRMRDDYGLFYRFISGDTSQRNYKTSASLYTPEDVKQAIENDLVKQFKNYEVEGIKTQLNKFNTFITNRCTQYEQYFKQNVSNGAHTPSVTNLRWWLNFSIYAKNKNISNKSIATILEAYMKKSLGKTTLQYVGKDGTPSNTNTQVGNLSSLSTVIKVIGLKTTILDGEIPKKRKKGPKLKPGYHNSHVTAHSNNGEITIPENAVDNLSRSNKNMPNDKYNDLCKFNEPLNKSKESTVSVSQTKIEDIVTESI